MTMDKTHTLLEQAKQIPVRRRSKTPYSEELLDVVLAWIHGEITTTQMNLVLDEHISGSSMVYKAVNALRHAVIDEKVIIQKKYGQKE